MKIGVDVDVDTQPIILTETNVHDTEQRQDDDESGINHPAEQRKDNDEGDAIRAFFSNTQPQIARMEVTTERNYHYKMNHKNRGLALIFNHKTFNYKLLGDRLGTDVDCTSLEQSLQSLGFTVLVHIDLTKDEICKILSDASLKDHADHDCIVICVLSHGEMGKLCARDTCYDVDMLWKHFTPDKCPSLAGKPKLFFIQACRGKKTDPGFPTTKTKTDGPEQTIIRFPLYADLLISYSSFPGFMAFRNTEIGTWFIQALAKRLRSDDGKCKSILDLLTLVSGDVAFDHRSYSPDTLQEHEKTQMPCFESTLTMQLIFGEKEATAAVNYTPERAIADAPSMRGSRRKTQIQQPIIEDQELRFSKLESRMKVLEESQLNQESKTKKQPRSKKQPRFKK